MPTGKGATPRASANPLDVYYRAAVEGLEVGRRKIAEVRQEAVRRGSDLGRELAALPPRALKVLDDVRTQRKAAAVPPRVRAGAASARPGPRPVMARAEPAPTGTPAPPARTDWNAKFGAGLNGAVDAATLGIANRTTAAVNALSGDGADRWVDRYQANLAREDARDRYDAEHHRGARVAGEIIGTVGSIAATGGLGGLAQGGLRGAQLGARLLPSALRLAPPAKRLAPLTSKATGWGRDALLQRFGPQAAIGGVGSGVSVAGQIVTDGMAGRLTRPEDLASSAAGGLTGALTTLYGGPVRGAAAEAAMTHRVRSLLTGEPISSGAVAADAGLGSVIGRYGHVLGARWAKGLPFAKSAKAPGDWISKGELGELLSRSLSRTRGLAVTDVGKGLRLKDGSLTFTDHRTGPNKVVEAKMGDSHKRLRPNQEKARVQLGDDYRVDHFLSDDIGKAYGGLLTLLFPPSPSDGRRTTAY